MDHIWRPTDEIVEHANVTRLVVRHDLGSYADLLARSREEVEWFWPTVIADLGIEFSRPYDRVLNTSRGIQWPLWFVGGEVNIADNCVERHREHGGVAVAFEDAEGETRSLSYEELGAEVAGVAEGLRSLGVRHGDPVGLFLPTIPEAVVALLACCALGAIGVPIPPGSGADVVADRLVDSGAQVLVTADGCLRGGEVVPLKTVADEAVEAAGGIRHVVVVRHLGCGAPMETQRDLWWHELVGGRGARVRGAATTSEDPFLIAYPSGSVHVHGGLLVKVAAEVAYHADLRGGEVLFWPAELGDLSGLWSVLGTLAVGGTVLCSDPAPDEPDRLFGMVERHRVDVLGLEGPVAAALARSGAEPRHDLSSLRILVTRGCTQEAARWLHATVGRGRCPVVALLGGIEAGGSFLASAPVVPIEAGSPGTPALGMAVEVDGSELVCTRPWPSMTRGFWGHPDRYIESYWTQHPGAWTHPGTVSVNADG